MSRENGAFSPPPEGAGGRAYLQRPEVLESIFYMYLLTGAGWGVPPVEGLRYLPSGRVVSMHLY